QTDALRNPRRRTTSGLAPHASGPALRTHGGPCCSSATDLLPRAVLGRARRRPVAAGRTAPHGRQRCAPPWTASPQPGRGAWAARVAPRPARALADSPELVLRAAVWPRG